MQCIDGRKIDLIDFKMQTLQIDFKNREHLFLFLYN